MLQKLFVAAFSLLSYTLSIAQTASVSIDSTAAAPSEDKKEPVLTITGSVDAYYRNDLADVKTNNYTSFTPLHNSFALGMASVKFEHKGKKVSAVADLGFGPRARDFAYTDDGVTQAVKQAYVSYSPADWIKLTLGTWGTHVGYEFLDPQLNRNYSMSYMFTNGPFSHTGLKAEVTKGKHGVMLGVANAPGTHGAEQPRYPPGEWEFYIARLIWRQFHVARLVRWELHVTRFVRRQFHLARLVGGSSTSPGSSSGSSTSPGSSGGSSSSSGR